MFVFQVGEKTIVSNKASEFYFVPSMALVPKPLYPIIIIMHSSVLCLFQISSPNQDNPNDRVTLSDFRKLPLEP